MSFRCLRGNQTEVCLVEEVANVLVGHGLVHRSHRALENIAALHHNPVSRGAREILVFDKLSKGERDREREILGLQ